MWRMLYRMSFIDEEYFAMYIAWSSGSKGKCTLKVRQT